MTRQPCLAKLPFHGMGAHLCCTMWQDEAGYMCVHLQVHACPNFPTMDTSSAVEHAGTSECHLP